MSMAVSSSRGIALPVNADEPIRLSQTAQAKFLRRLCAKPEPDGEPDSSVLGWVAAQYRERFGEMRTPDEMLTLLTAAWGQSTSCGDGGYDSPSKLGCRKRDPRRVVWR